MDNWSYGFGDEVTQVKDFQLHVTTNFAGFDLLENTLSPTNAPGERVGGVELQEPGIGLPRGHRAAAEAATGAASVILRRFHCCSYFCAFPADHREGDELHPINYFFLACAFFLSIY